MTGNDQKLKKAIQTVAPGSELRSALDLIIAASNGALLVIGESDSVLSLSNGGFELASEMSAERLFELAKMDGAIILSKDAKNIVLANVHLVPDPSIVTTETGIRHRTAERVARQTGSLVISISEQRATITIFVDDIKYSLEDVRIVLAKANQALQTLEKYRHRLDTVLASLNTLEFESLVTLLDVVTAVQRAELVKRIANEIKGYINELGNDARLIEMQLDESIGNVDRETIMLLNDYIANRSKVKAVEKELSDLTPEDLLELDNIANLLGYAGYADMQEVRLEPKGYRIISRIPRLPDSVIYNIVGKFKKFNKILDASIEQLDDVEGVGIVRAHAIRDGLRRLREYNLIERYA